MLSQRFQTGAVANPFQITRPDSNTVVIQRGAEGPHARLREAAAEPLAKEELLRTRFAFLAPEQVRGRADIDARADQGVVFVVDADGKARRRAVETGGVSDRGVTVLKGLSAGDSVITRGASMVRDGDAVSVAKQ